jgi:MFS family permease
MVVSAGILSSIGYGFYGNGISVFFKDLASDVGLSRAMTSFAGGFGQLEGGIMSSLTGWLTDKFGPRWVIFSGICITATGMAMIYFITSPWQYFLAWGLLAGIGTTIGCTVAIDKTITNWFMRKRGLALSIKFALMGLCTVILLPIVSKLVSGLGWRMTCLVWSLLLLACAPIMLLIIKQGRPEHYGLLPDGARPGSDAKPGCASALASGGRRSAGVDENEFTFRQAMRTRTFWLIAGAFAVFELSYGGIRIHIVPFLTDMGVERTVASGIMSMTVFFMIPARFIGVIGDRVHSRTLVYLLGGTFALTAIGIGIFLLFQSSASVYVMLISHGISSGAVSPLIVLTLGRYFGRKAFGSIFGTCMMIQAPAQLLGPVYAGRMYDTTGSYTRALVLFSAVSVLAAVLICFAKTPEAAREHGIAEQAASH